MKGIENQCGRMAARLALVRSRVCIGRVAAGCCKEWRRHQATEFRTRATKLTIKSPAGNAGLAGAGGKATADFIVIDVLLPAFVLRALLVLFQNLFLNSKSK